MKRRKLEEKREGKEADSEGRGRDLDDGEREWEGTLKEKKEK